MVLPSSSIWWAFTVSSRSHSMALTCRYQKQMRRERLSGPGLPQGFKRASQTQRRRSTKKKTAAAYGLCCSVRDERRRSRDARSGSEGIRGLCEQESPNVPGKSLRKQYWTSRGREWIEHRLAYHLPT